MTKKEQVLKIGKCLHRMSQPMQVLVASTSIMETLIKKHGIDDLSIDRINNSASELADMYQECVLLIKDILEELDYEVQ